MKLILALCLLTLPLLGQEWPKEWGIKPDTNVLSDVRLIGWDSVEISNIDPEDNKKREVRKLALNNLLQYLSVNVKSEMTSKDRYVSAIGSLIKEIDGKTVVDIIDTKEQITSTNNGTNTNGANTDKKENMVNILDANNYNF